MIESDAYEGGRRRWRVESGDEVDAIAGSANVWGRNIGR